jgi:hypothetical protein
LFLAAAGLLVAGGFAIRGSHLAQVPVRTQILRAGQSIVQSTLAEGIHAAFGGEEETVVEPMSDGKTMVSGWVDLINDAGQHDRQNYSVIVYKDSTNGWMGERITVIPQM